MAASISVGRPKIQFQQKAFVDATVDFSSKVALFPPPDNAMQQQTGSSEHIATIATLHRPICDGSFYLGRRHEVNGPSRQALKRIRVLEYFANII